MAQDEAKPIGPDLSQGISLDQLADGKITPEDWTAIPQEQFKRSPFAVRDPQWPSDPPKILATSAYATLLTASHNAAETIENFTANPS